jgi:hypothetical protein
MKQIVYSFCILISLSACTIVTTSNLPGKAAKTFPKHLLGKFELKYPSSMDGMMEGAGVSTELTFTKTEIQVKTGEEITKMTLNDSVFYSTIGKQGYISLGSAPNYTVIKVVKNGKDFDLFTMNATTAISKSDMEPFFKQVTEETTTDENGETNTSFNVTIDDAKLEKYFSSEFVDKDPFKLIKIKK